jgi:hypothetical protein
MECTQITHTLLFVYVLLYYLTRKRDTSTPLFMSRIVYFQHPTSSFCHITRISAICVNLDLSFSQYLTVFFKVITIHISNMHHMFFFPQCLVQITFQFLYLANFHQKYFHCFCVKACL